MQALYNKFSNEIMLVVFNIVSIGTIGTIGYIINDSNMIEKKHIRFVYENKINNLNTEVKNLRLENLRLENKTMIR